MRQTRSKRTGRRARHTATRNAPSATGFDGAIDALVPFRYYKMNMASGAAIDSSPNAPNNAAATGSPTYRNIVGPDGDSYAGFPGASGFSIPNNVNLSLDGVQELTFVLLFRPDTYAAVISTLFSKFDSTREYLCSQFNTGVSNRLLMNVYQNNLFASHARTDFQTALVIDRWHLAMITLKGNEQPEMYMNSLTQGGDTLVAPTGNAPLNANQVLEIGRLSAFADYQFRGHMAHFAVFNRKLTSVERASLHAAAVAGGWIS